MRYDRGAVGWRSELRDGPRRGVRRAPGSRVRRADRPVDAHGLGREATAPGVPTALRSAAPVRWRRHRVHERRFDPDGADPGGERQRRGRGEAAGDRRVPHGSRLAWCSGNRTKLCYEHLYEIAPDGAAYRTSPTCCARRSIDEPPAADARARDAGHDAPGHDPRFCRRGFANLLRSAERHAFSSSLTIGSRSIERWEHAMATTRSAAGNGVDR